MIVSRTFKLAGAAVLASLALAAAPAPKATPSPQEAITTRQASYKKMGTAMKALNEQLKSDAPAPGVMAEAARTIAATARGQGALFPAGSGREAGIKTDALPNIWTDRTTFDAKMTSMVAEATKLATVASGTDIEAIRAQVKATGASCKACHVLFRADT